MRHGKRNAGGFLYTPQNEFLEACFCFPLWYCLWIMCLEQLHLSHSQTEDKANPWGGAGLRAAQEMGPESMD